MEKDLTYFEGLTASYLSGEASPAEVSELSAWVAEKPGNAEIFKSSQEAWTALESHRLDEKIDVEAELKNIEYRTGAKRSSTESKSFGEAVMNTNEISNFVNNVEFQTSVSPSHHLTISPFTKHPASSIQHLSYFLLRAAAVIILLAVPTFFLYRYFTKPVMQELAANTSRVDTELPDGSRVTLNTGAVLRYPEKFKGKKRAVSLDGEAYFDVAHNAAKPFIISTDGIRVEVKGTSFYINTRSSEGDFELVLTTGKVELYFENAPEKARVIMPGEKAVLHDGQIMISPNTDPNYMAWKTHRITFSNDPLEVVTATLSKVYQTRISLKNNDLTLCRLTATFDNQSLESVLNVLKATLDLEIRNSGSLVEISGKGCK